MTEEIRFSGLPLMLSGWNNKYIKQDDNTYYLAAYKLYWLIPIIGVTIKKITDKWRLIRDGDCFCDSDDDEIGIYKLGNDQDSPIGEWTYGAIVSKV